MAGKVENNPIDDILFDGGSLPDTPELRDADETPSDSNYDVFGTTGSEEEEDQNEPQQMPTTKVSETKAPVENNPQLDALLSQNQKLMDLVLAQSANKQEQPQLTQQQQQFMAIGQQLSNLPMTDPAKYAALQRVLSGQEDSVKADIKKVKDIFKKPEYADTNPEVIEAVVDMIEKIQNTNSLEKQQYGQALAQLSTQVNNLVEQNKSSAQKQVDEKKQNIYHILKKAETDFGITIDRESDEAEMLVSLINRGRDPRKSFLKVYGKTEEDVISQTGKKEVVKEIPHPKLVKETSSPLMPNQNRLADKLFGTSKRSSDLFAK